MIVGIVGVAVAIVWEFYGTRKPVLRRSLFCSPTAITTYAYVLS
jgi:hypothetical protein